MAQKLTVVGPIMLRRFHESIGFKSFHLQRTASGLTGDLRKEQKGHPRAMLPFLHAAEPDRWHHLMTGDKSWFFFNTLPLIMCILSKDDLVTKSRHDNQSKKCLFMMIWNPRGFDLVDRLPNDAKRNSA
jgi:hypothetical protein